MKLQRISSFVLAGLLLLCLIPVVHGDESTDLTNMAIVLINNGSGDYQRAIGLIDRALAINSSAFGGRTYALELKSYAQIQMGNYTAALETVNEGLAYEESAPLWNNKGFISYKMGDYSAAVESYDRALTVDPTFTVAMLNKGNALMEMKKYQDAVDAYTRAFEMDREANDLSFSQQVKTWNNVGDAYYNLGKYTESSAAFEKALAIEPGNTTATAGLAMAQQKAQSASFLTIGGLVTGIVVCGIAAFYLFRKKQDATQKRPSKKSKK